MFLVRRRPEPRRPLRRPPYNPALFVVAPSSVVQSRSDVTSGVNFLDLAFLSSVTAGNHIMVTQASFGAGHTILTPTDTLLHTYVPMTAEQSSSNIRLRSFYVEDIDGGANTVHFEKSVAGGELSVTIAEIFGLKKSGSLDQTQVGTATGTAVSSGDITPTEANCFLYGAMTHVNNNVGITEDAADGWTLLQEQIPVSTISVATQWKKQGAAALEDADWVLASSSTWIAHVASFLEDTGAPMGSGQLLSMGRNRLVLVT